MPTATLTETETASATETATATETPTETPTVTLTPTDLPLETATATASPADLPTLTETASATATPDFGTPTATAISTATASATAPAFGAEPQLTPLFTDNFDTGALYLWTLGAGWALARSENGQALTTTTDEPVTFVHNTLLDAAVQARFQFTQGMVRLSLRQSDAGAYTAVLNADGNLALYRGSQPMASAVVPPNQPEQWRTIRLSAIGDLVRVSIDGVEILAAQDINPLPIGTFSFASMGTSGLLVDDVSVWILGNTIPDSATETSDLSPAPSQPLSVANFADFPFLGDFSISYWKSLYTNSCSPTCIIRTAGLAGVTTTYTISFSQVASNASGLTSNLDWSPDGRYAVFGCNVAYLVDDGCVAYLQDDNTLSVIGRLGLTSFKGADWSPETNDPVNQYLLFMNASGSNDLNWSLSIKRIMTAGLQSTVDSASTIVIRQGDLNIDRCGISLTEPEWGLDNYIYFGVERYYPDVVGQNYPPINERIGIYRINYADVQQTYTSAPPKQRVISWGNLKTTFPTGTWFEDSGMYLPTVNQAGHIAFTAHNSGSKIILYQVSGNPTLTLLADGTAPNYSPDGLYLAYLAPTTQYYNLQVYVPSSNTTYTVAHDLPDGETETAWKPKTAVLTCAASGASEIIVQTSLSRCEIEEELAQYNVQISNSGGREWTDTELQAVRDAVIDTAQALYLNTTQVGEPLLTDVFKNIMGPITFIRNNESYDNCKTDNNEKTISCRGNVTITKHTVVHELGHVLDNRAATIGTDQQPKKRLADRMASGTIVADCGEDSGRVMGENYNDPYSWTRGERGWGSGPARDQQIGDEPLITTFQQNVLLSDFQGIVGTSNYEPNPDVAKMRRVEESSADMFLNWVYRRLSSVPPVDKTSACAEAVPGQAGWNGYLNKDWRDVPNTPQREDVSSSATAGEDDPTNSGSMRYLWMNNTINTILQEHGW